MDAHRLGRAAVEVADDDGRQGECGGRDHEHQGREDEAAAVRPRDELTAGDRPDVAHVRAPGRSHAASRPVAGSEPPLLASGRPDPFDEDVLDRRVGDLEAGDVRTAIEGQAQDGFGVTAVPHREFVIVEPRAPHLDVRQGIQPGQLVVARDGDPDDTSAGLTSHLVGRAVHQQSTVVDDGDGVAELLDLLHLVGAEDDGAAPPRELQERLLQHRGVDGVQTAEWLVHEQDIGVVEDARDELDLLLVALAELVGAPVRVLTDPEPRQPVPCPSGRLGAGEALQRAEEHQLVEDAHTGVEPAVLRQISPGGSGDRRSGLAVPGHGALVGVEDVEDDAHRRGLPRAVRSQEAEHLAGLDRETDAVEGDDILEALAEVREDQGHATLWSRPGTAGVGGRSVSGHPDLHAQR